MENTITSCAESVGKTLGSGHDALAKGLTGYVEQAILSETMAAQVKAAIGQGKNILVTGGTSTGKTLLCNVLINEWAAQYRDGRILVVEDIREIQTSATNVVHQIEAWEMSADEWAGIIAAYGPEAMVIGEIRRGNAANALLRYWKDKSRSGFATLFGSRPEKALGYLSQMLLEDEVPEGPALITEAVDYVLHLEKPRPGKRVCSGIWVIDSYDVRAGTFKLAPAV